MIDEAFPWILSLVMAMIGWWVRVMWEAQKDLRKDLSDLEKGLPQTYMRRDDFNKRFDELISAVHRIEDKLDAKVDKP